MSEETNEVFRTTNKLFQESCVLAEIPVTKRQASKFRRQKGLAFKCWRGAARSLVRKRNLTGIRKEKEKRNA